VCGICGELSKDGQAIPSSAMIGRMTEQLIPRGPDAVGMFQQNRFAVGHRRLSILDLTPHAHQPMIDNTLGLGIAYNGEVYNFRDLRKELEAKGYSFFSTGDTEVLLKAYHAWGDEFVKRLNGMFAFAIWERDSGRVLLGRDRLGIKPLYYADTPTGLRFASSLPSLLQGGGISSEIDPVALHHYMTFHAVVPAPRTILKQVRKLDPASIMAIEPDGTKKQSFYWEPSFNVDPAKADWSFEDWKRAIHDKLMESVQRRLIADVPVGVLLSGGLDSSLVVGLLAEAGQTGLNTFSIGFESVGEEKGDEFEYSDIVAEHFGTRHHKIHVDTGKALPALGEAVAAMSEPMVSHDCVGFFLLSQEVARHVKVVQSGQGADEVFAGYHWYPPLMQSEDPVNDYASVFFDRDHGEYAEIINPEYVGTNQSLEFVAEHFARPGADRAIDKALRLDTRVMLIDDPVKRVDNMTMAWSLEARVPFLDHELVELAGHCPAEMKVGPIDEQGRGVGKHVLKELARDVIPEEVIDRPKGYFPVPALKFLRGEYLELVRDILTQPAARERALVNNDYINTLLADPERHITPLRGSKLWQVALLEYWLQTHEV